MKTTVPPKRFCAAPWMEGVLRIGGEMNPCCRNDYSYGDYVRSGLRQVWNGPEAQAFRKEISEGRFPNFLCKNCWKSGTATSPARFLTHVLHTHWEGISAFLHTILDFDWGNCQVMLRFSEVVHAEPREMTPEIRQMFVDYFEFLFYLRHALEHRGIEYPSLSIDKLEVIGRALYGFLSGDLQPQIVSPCRQLQLIAHCNARCIQCPGLFTGSIVHGHEVNGVFRPSMDDDELEQAFAHPGDVTDFWMNGSEFLLYKRWREVAEKLNGSGVRFSLSTNGILLHKKNVDWLFSKDYLSNLNISIDGATKETIEAVRVNVKYDRLAENLRYLFEVVEQKGYEISISFSFVIMKCNFHEIPELFRLINRLREGRSGLRLGVLLQSLDSVFEPAYEVFINEQHLSKIDETVLRNTLKEALELSREYDITARAFYSWRLDEFLEKNLPLPGMPAVGGE